MKSYRDIKSVFDPADESFVEAVNRTLIEIRNTEEQAVMKKKFRVSIAFAIILCLLIAGCAIALSYSGLLDSLFNKQTPPQEAVELVETVNESATNAGITVTMEEYIYDGENLALSYTIENDADQTLFVYNRDFHIGQVTDPSGNTVGSFAGWGTPTSPKALGGSVEGTPIKKSMRCGLQAEVPAQSQGRELILTVHADVYRPLVPLAASEKTAGEDGLWLEYGEVSWESPRMDALYDAHYKKSFENGVQGDLATALVEAGMLEKIGEVSLTQALTPKTTYAAQARSVTLDAPITMEAGEYLLTLEDLHFTTVFSRYTMILRRRDGKSIRSDPNKDDWVYSTAFDGYGNDLDFGMGGSVRVAADGVDEYILQYDAVLAEMPDALLFCPQRTGYFERQEGERFDLSRSVRLEIENGKVVPPNKTRARTIIYAPDFQTDLPGDGRTLIVKARTWDEDTLSEAFAGGEKLPSDANEPGYFHCADGTTLIVEPTAGRLVYRSGKLSDEYWSLMIQLKQARANLGGSLADFSPEDALGTLDQALGTLGLRRGRTLNLSAYDKQALRDAYARYRSANYLSWDESENTPERVEQWDKQAQAEIAKAETPEGGYFIAVSLCYNDVPCVPEERSPKGISMNLPLGSGIAAFVNPNGVMYLTTLDGAAIYFAQSGDAKEAAVIPFEEAQQKAEEYLTIGKAGDAVKVKRAFYEYLPVWEGEGETQLTLVPVWSFYAARNDGALYPLVYVDARSGELRF